MRYGFSLVTRQAVLFTAAALAYFGVRGITEGDVESARRNADQLLDVEQAMRIDLEHGLQEVLLDKQQLVDLANWIYIWGHWPVVIATLIVLVFNRREQFFELRNAMFISGAIGLVIFATFPVAPPRLFGGPYVDTVTVHSEAYRLLQPPALVNKFAAVPSLHFGWNLLVALAWRRNFSGRGVKVAAALMPASMAFAVVATANHWTFDVLAGGAVALTGLGIERLRQRWGTRRADRGTVDGEPRDASRDSDDGVVIDLRDRPGGSVHEAGSDSNAAPDRLHGVSAAEPRSSS